MPLPRSFLPLAGFLALGLAQLFFGLTLTPIATRESLLKLATYACLFFVVVQLFADAPVATWRRVGITVLAFGFVFSFLSVLQHFWNPSRILWVGHDVSNPFGPYVNRNHYAGLMELIIPVAAAYVLSRPKHDPLRGVLWFGVLVPLVSVLMTGSRGGFLAVVVEIALLGWVLVWRNPLPSRRNRTALAVGALVAVAAVFAWLVPAYVAERIGSVNNYAPEARAGFRLTVWKGALGVFADRPLSGTGMGSFVTVYPQFEKEISDLVTEHAHNDYLEALAETGLLGGGLIIAALILFFSLAFRDLFPQLKIEPGWIQVGAAIGCCGLMVHSFADFNLHIPANAAWFAFSAGLASISGRVAFKG